MSEPRQDSAPPASPAPPAPIPLVRAPGVISLDMAVSRVRRHAGLAVSGAAGLAGEVLRRWAPRDAGFSGEGLTYAFPPVVTAEPVPSPNPPTAPAVSTAAGPSLLERPRAASGGGGPVVGTLRRSLAGEGPAKAAPAPPVVLPRSVATAEAVASPAGIASEGSARAADLAPPVAPSPQTLPIPPISAAAPLSPRSPLSPAPPLSEPRSPSLPGAPPAASPPPTPRLELGRPVVRRSALASPEPLPQRSEPSSPPVAVAAPISTPVVEPGPAAARPAVSAPALPPVSLTTAAPAVPPAAPQRELGRPVLRRSALASREALVQRRPTTAEPGVPTPAAPLPLPEAAPISVEAPAARPPLARASALPAGASRETPAPGSPPAASPVPISGISSPPDLPLSRTRSGRLGPALVQRSPLASPSATPPILAIPEIPAAGEPVPSHPLAGSPVSTMALPLVSPAPGTAGPGKSSLSPPLSTTTPTPSAPLARRASVAPTAPSSALALPAVPFTGASPNLGLAILRRRLDVPLQQRLSAAAAPGVSTPETGESGGAAPSFLPLPPSTPSPVANPAVPGPRSAAGSSALPLARVLQPSFTSRPGGIQRDLMGGAPSGAPESPPAPTPAPPSAPAASGGGAPAAGSATPAEDKHDKAVEAEELAERIVRRVLRTLAVEGERRGLSSWL